MITCNNYHCQAHLLANLLTIPSMYILVIKNNFLKKKRKKICMLHKMSTFVIFNQNFLFFQAPQSASIRTALRGKYAAAKLYQANQLYVPSDLLDIGINPGDLVSFQTRYKTLNSVQ